MTKENPNAFKHAIGKDLLQRMAKSLTEVWPDFDQNEFLSLGPALNSHELKARVKLIRDQLKKILPPDYKVSLHLLLQSLQSGRLKGFDLWPYTEFIQTYGLEQVEASVQALYEITPLFTGEFAIRPFLKNDPARILKLLNQFALDQNVHVRRWASEGSRPRLPWGERLDYFILKPQSTLPLLEKLKFDEELYVRKSVANHLNDISKDHPALVVKLLKKWKNSAPAKHQKKIDWIILRSLRTLIKNGDPSALLLIGAGQNAKIKTRALRLKSKSLRVGHRMEFSLELTSLSAQKQKLIVDYVIHYLKANKKTSAKVYKFKTLILEPRQSLKLQKVHSLRPITTRRYYPGPHQLEIQINGKIYESTKWDLLP